MFYNDSANTEIYTLVLHGGLKSYGYVVDYMTETGTNRHPTETMKFNDVHFCCKRSTKPMESNEFQWFGFVLLSVMYSIT